MSGWHHTGKFKEKPCKVCGASFKPFSGMHSFCSEKCRGKWKYVTGQFSTETQYKKISGNWQRYFCRMRARSNERKVSITVQDLHDLLAKQGGKCAMSGVEMTCSLIKGKRSETNASMDRIMPGGPYTKENVQLVCAALNSFRRDVPLTSFIDWCIQVARYHEEKKGL